VLEWFERGLVKMDKEKSQKGLIFRDKDIYIVLLINKGSIQGGIMSNKR
jgi:hypothetical protein